MGAEHKMTNSVRQQIDAFLKGLHEIVPPDMLSLFDDKELELLISGLPDIDVEDLKANTEYHNYTPQSEQVQWFWKALKNFQFTEHMAQNVCHLLIRASISWTCPSTLLK